MIDPTQHAIARMRSIRALGSEVSKAKEAISRELMKLRAAHASAEVIAKLEKLAAAERHADIVLHHLVLGIEEASGVKEPKQAKGPAR